MFGRTKRIIYICTVIINQTKLIQIQVMKTLLTTLLAILLVTSCCTSDPKDEPTNPITPKEYTTVSVNITMSTNDTLKVVYPRDILNPTITDITYITKLKPFNQTYKVIKQNKTVDLTIIATSSANYYLSLIPTTPTPTPKQTNAYITIKLNNIPLSNTDSLKLTNKTTTRTLYV